MVAPRNWAYSWGHVTATQTDPVWGHAVHVCLHGIHAPGRQRNPWGRELERRGSRLLPGDCNLLLLSILPHLNTDCEMTSQKPNFPTISSGLYKYLVSELGAKS